MAREQRQPTKRTRFLDAQGKPAVSAERGTTGQRAHSGSRSRTARGAGERTAWYRPTFGKVALMALLLVVVVFAAQLCSSASPINVTVNGTQYSLRGEKTLQVALKESGLPINPGDLISLKGNILQKSAGDPFSATVNGQETADPDYKLKNGDVVSLTDGKDIVESYDAVEGAVPFGASIVGLGSVHVFTPGADGVVETRTGQLSGEVIDKQTVDPTDLVETRSDPDVGDAKVIALTFDGGPSTLYTEGILDILAENGAKATFFCRGDAIRGEGADLVRRAASEGHQICTHSYDDAELVNGEMSHLGPDELASEVTRGLQAIADALGTEEEPYEPSKLVRVGSQDLDEQGVLAVAPLVNAEIGWTLDTGDWVYMSENDIYGVLMSAKPGAIIRMHDGGDHQDVTAAALKRALPKLAKKGYSFATVDELLALAGYETGGAEPADVLE